MKHFLDPSKLLCSTAIACALVAATSSASAAIFRWPATVKMLMGDDPDNPYGPQPNAHSQPSREEQQSPAPLVPQAPRPLSEAPGQMPMRQLPNQQMQVQRAAPAQPVEQEATGQAVPPPPSAVTLPPKGLVALPKVVKAKPGPGQSAVLELMPQGPRPRRDAAHDSDNLASNDPKRKSAPSPSNASQATMSIKKPIAITPQPVERDWSDDALASADHQQPATISMPMTPASSEGSMALRPNPVRSQREASADAVANASESSAHEMVADTAGADDPSRPNRLSDASSSSNKGRRNPLR